MATVAILDAACGFLDYLDVYYDREAVAAFVAGWTELTADGYRALVEEWRAARRHRCQECGEDMGPGAETRQLCGKTECLNVGFMDDEESDMDSSQ